MCVCIDLHAAHTTTTTIGGEVGWLVGWLIVVVVVVVVVDRKVSERERGAAGERRGETEG